MRAGGHVDSLDLAADQDVTVLIARERFSVMWTRTGLQLAIDAGRISASVHHLTAVEARQLADLLGTAADLEDAA